MATRQQDSGNRLGQQDSATRLGQGYSATQDSGNKIRAINRVNCLRCLKPAIHSAEALAEIVMVEQFIAIVPAAAKNWILCNEPDSIDEAIRLMESFEIAGRSAYPAGQLLTQHRAEGRPSHKEGLPPGKREPKPTEARQPTRPLPPRLEPVPTPLLAKPTLSAFTCFQCGKRGHLKRDCPVMDCAAAEAWKAAQGSQKKSSQIKEPIS